MAHSRDYKGVHKGATLIGAGVLVHDSFANNQVTTSINVEELKNVLKGMLRRKPHNDLVEGFRYGFKLGHTREEKVSKAEA